MSGHLTYEDIEFEPATAPEAYLLSLMKNAHAVVKHNPGCAVDGELECPFCEVGVDVYFSEEGELDG